MSFKEDITGTNNQDIESQGAETTIPTATWNPEGTSQVEEPASHDLVARVTILLYGPRYSNAMLLHLAQQKYIGQICAYAVLLMDFAFSAASFSSTDLYDCRSREYLYSMILAAFGVLLLIVEERYGIPPRGQAIAVFSAVLFLVKTLCYLNTDVCFARKTGAGGERAFRFALCLIGCVCASFILNSYAKTMQAFDLMVAAKKRSQAHNAQTRYTTENRGESNDGQDSTTENREESV